ncbi:MAG: T9SS type A sorting domain-containing protein, partial [Bacteroidia bacterium]|nr:T9SS type A sorting domain-containing protein [Bacteroidia bacterium]
DDLSYNQSFQRNHERFLKEFDELIPVEVLPDLLMWFSQSDFVLDVISNHQVSDNFKLEKSRLVRLNENELAKLNITYQNNGIKVPTYVNGPRNIYSIYNNKETISELSGFNFKPINSLDSSVFSLDTTNRQVNINLGANLQITPVLITNADGITWRQYELETEKFMTEEELNFMNSHHPSPKDYQPYLIAKIKAKEALAAQINTLLPIAIKHPTIQNLGIIAWYKPDSNLINLLPANIAREIKREADIITNNKQGINCQYFETCDAVKILYEVNIHPNPVEQLFSIKIETGELRKFSIHITNIEGKIIKTITKGKMLHAGTHELPCNISDLAPGIYLLQVNTELDELIVKRLIKK